MPNALGVDAHGRPSTPRPAVARVCRAVGKGLHTAVAKKHSRFTIETYAADGTPCKQGGDEVTVTITGTSVVRARVYDNEDGTYRVEYKASASGPYSVNVLLHGSPLPGSPWRLDVVMGRPDATQCSVRGDALRSTAAREVASFEVSFVDTLGQPTFAEELDVYVEPFRKDVSLDQLEGTGAEAAALAWARQWALLRLAKKRGESLQELRARLQLPTAANGGTAADPGEGNDAPPPEPPAYADSTVREVGGYRPLIVRSGPDLDSQQTGSIGPGARLVIVETRKLDDGSVRALVLVDGNQAVRRSLPRGSPCWSVPQGPRARHGRVNGSGAAHPAEPPQSWVESGEWPAEELPRDAAPAAPTSITDLEVWSPTSSLLVLPGEPEASPPKSPYESAFKRRQSDRSQSPAGTVPSPDTGHSDDVEAELEALTHEVMAFTHGWVTAARNGHELLPRGHDGVDAAARQRHTGLWERRKALEKTQAWLIAKQGAQGSRLNEHAKAELKAGPCCATDVTHDPAGIGFAFGGVEPGTLHAHGQIIKAHTVRYSVSCAGKYWLHVGLRQQEARLPGSPFLLEVAPGIAHARSSELPRDNVPLMGTVVGSEGVSASMVVALRDQVGNRCVRGGADLKVTTIRRDGESRVHSTCVDLENGTYRLEWQSQVAGTCIANVTIANVHLIGSPIELTLRAGPPDIAKIQASGQGLASAQAGIPALVCLDCKDTFDNVASYMEGISFGLKLLPRDSKVKNDEQEVESMDFESSFVDDQYQIRYTAQEAGDFNLHLWTVAEGKRRFLSGSPFAVRVSGVRASPAKSYIMYDEQHYHNGPASAQSLAKHNVRASLTAGERLQLQIRLHDAFGNASTAVAGALVCYMDMNVDDPDTELSKRVELPIRELRAMGSYEAANDLTRKGLHAIGVELNGEHIKGSPFNVLVCASTAIASKSLLTAPEESPLVHSVCVLRLQAVDKYGNKADRGGASVNARVIGTGVSTVTVDDVGDGIYTLSFSGAVAGECRVVVRLDNHEMAPLTVAFVKAADDAGAAGANKQDLIREKKGEFEQAGDYNMASVYAKMEGEKELTSAELLDSKLVHTKVAALTHLGEMKWRYRVCEKGETPRGAAIAILTQANEVVDSHITRVVEASSAGSKKKDIREAQMRHEWAAELSEIWMGLALARLIFRGDKNDEDRTISKLLAQAQKARKEARLFAPLAETHNALGSLKQKQKNYKDAESEYEKSLEIRLRLASEQTGDDEETIKKQHQSIAQSQVSLGNLYLEMADTDAVLNPFALTGTQKQLLEQALEKLLAAKDSYVAGFSEMHPKLAQPWESICKVQLSLGQGSAASAAIGNAVAIREKFAPLDAATGERAYNKELEAAYKLQASVEERQHKRTNAQAGDMPDESFKALRARRQSVMPLPGSPYPARAM